MEENKSNNKLYLAIIALLLLLLLGAGFALWNENKAKNDLTDAKAKLETEFKTLSDSLDAKAAELEVFKGKNAELDSMIVAQQAEIEQQKKQIQGLFARGKMNAAELTKAKEMLAKYETSIAEMQKKIEELTAQNQQLTTQNQQLSTDLNAEKATTAQLSETNKTLSKKVELGSLLQLRNLEVAGVKKKGNGDDKVIKRAKAVESLRISFETGDNKVLEPGTATLYIRVINPKGETIAVADKGSGTIKLAESGETIQYTQKADFEWNQTNKKIVVYWSSNVNSEGSYKVEVYQSGYLVGKGAVELN